MTDFEQAKRIIKGRISCLDVADAIGFPHSRFGRSICPFHPGADNPTSFIMYPIDNIHDGGYYCRSCHEAGDVIRFVQKMNGIKYAEAIYWLKDTFKLNLPEKISITNKDVNKLNREAQLRAELYQCADLAPRLYCKVMEDGKTELIPESENLHSRIEKMLQSFKKL